MSGNIALQPDFTDLILMKQGHQEGKPVVFIFDQFEDIITRAIQEDDSFATAFFFDHLGELLKLPDVHAVFALRDECMGMLQQHAETLPTRLENRFRIDFLSRAAAVEVVTRIAESGGRCFEGEAASMLVDELAGTRLDAALMQIVCRQMWEALPRGTSSIGMEQLHLFVGILGALAQCYDGVMAKVAAGDIKKERFFREWIDRRLIIEDKLFEHCGRNRIPDPNRTLLPRYFADDWSTVPVLMEAHLLRSEMHDGLIWYELSNERLVEPVRRSNAAWFETHLNSTQRLASQWAAQGEPPDLLLSGRSLREAWAWMEANHQDWFGLDVGFILASRTANQKRRREYWLIRVAIGSAIGGVLLLLASGIHLALRH